MDINMKIDSLADEIRNSQNILTAIGDRTRQHLILVMMQTKECTGMRVGEIAKQTHLSRPAVSHHLQILKKSGIIKMRREATKNYYYFDTDIKSLDQLIQMLNLVKEIMHMLPDRKGEI